MRAATVWMILAAAVAGRPASAQDRGDVSGLAADAELVETRTQVPRLKAAAAYEPRDGIVEIELSEYAGYAGLIAANRGLEPSDESIFSRRHGFKLRITISEEESWSALNAGRMAASATTVDVLAAYGEQFKVKVPALIGFSRGADGIVVLKEIARINDLKGRVIATAQFTEADFLLRYLAQEAGLGVNMLPDLSTAPDPGQINVVYCADAFGAGDLFLRDLKAGRKRLAGCVTWAPKTTEVAEASGGAAHVLVTNRNLLIVADVLVVNAGFAKNHPAMVHGLVAGLLEGNALVREKPEDHLAAIARAFGWTTDEAREELAKVHLANFPENQAFFAGTLESAGSFEYIFETAGYVYGSRLIGALAPAGGFIDPGPLAEIERSGQFRNQKAAITPIKGRGGPAETDPDAERLETVALLSKDIRFQFKPNSSKLESDNEQNRKGLQSIAQLVKVSPGSTVLLRGHADGSLAVKARQTQGEAKAREMFLALKSLSRARCAEVKRVLEESFRIDPQRIEAQGVGADEPTGQGPDADRRVEVLWMVLE